MVGSIPALLNMPAKVRKVTQKQPVADMAINAFPNAPETLRASQ